MFADKTYQPPKTQTCPINKIMKKLNEDEKDKTRLKLDEKDIFVGKDSKKEPTKKSKKKRKKN
tara:strand:+ start:75 stop:263 length:189 start_codon:yes stop_codon:yes gene_type:complete